MCLYARDTPCVGIGRIAEHICTLLALDDIEIQVRAQQLLHVHTHDGARCGSSTIILDYHPGGDG